MIAQVIVDVAAKQTDRPFEYEVPSEFDDLSIGSRVIVPFGHRRVQGFVVKLSDHQAFEGKLKKLLVVVDEQPPLTPELVALSAVLADQIFSYRITILQTMLPYMMRANYRKRLVPVSKTDSSIEPVDFDRLTSIKQLVWAKDLLKKGKARIEYVVENRARAKLEIQYDLPKPVPDYHQLEKHLRKNAKNQQQLLQFLRDHMDDFPMMTQKLMHDSGLPISTLKAAVTKNWLCTKEVEVYRDPLKSSEVKPSKPLKLNSEQASALQKIVEQVQAKKARTFLLEGVTGSGKTEVYLQAIDQALSIGRNALMLVPEIALTPQMVRQVKSRFGTDVAVLHSSLSAGERYDEWRRIRRGEARVVVGARSAVFAPIANLGLIVMDEEHEASYKQEDTPRYHARDVARWRSAYHHCPLILGSATPDLTSRARAQKDVYQLLRLTKRANHHALPQVELIDLKKTKFVQDQFDLSAELVTAIKTRLKQKEQVILMLNRRGFANFMLCRNCGFVLRCPNCDVSLTLHQDTQRMQCHYCGYHMPVPKCCPNCQSREIRFLGTGTQKVEAELQKLVPEARLLRMDVDTTRRKNSYKKILDQFAQQKADILLGTQMVAKGLDFPNVTLVGVINADTTLWLPNYNASERTFDLLTQVAGRAGRAQKTGHVLIQTYNPEHYAIKLAQTQDYERFYQHELAVRYQGNYPPFFYTILISVASENSQDAAKEAFNIKRQLMQQLHLPTIVLGPTPSAISRLKKQYYYQILVKYKKEPKLKALLHQVQDSAQVVKKKGLNVYIDLEPQKIM